MAKTAINAVYKLSFSLFKMYEDIKWTIIYPPMQCATITSFQLKKLKSKTGFGLKRNSAKLANLCQKFKKTFSFDP